MPKWWLFKKANPIDSVSFETGSFLMQWVNRIFIVFQESSGCIQAISLLQCVGNSMRRDSYDYKRSY